MRIQQNVTLNEKILKLKTHLISQANGSKVVCIYLLTLMPAFLKADFHLYVEYYIM